MDYKQCSKCKEYKLLTYFNKCNTVLIGKSSHCKKCQKAWRDQNKDKVKACQKAWRDKNKDKINKYKKAWLLTNVDHIKNYQKIF